MLLKQNAKDFEKSFDTLGLSEPVMQAIERLKFKKPTEI
jgi:superfamily II DNA/RNA helicase